MRGSLDGDGVSPCVSSGPRNKKRFPARWSLRQLIYSSPILGRRRSGQSASASGSRPSHRREGRDILDGRLSSTSKDNDRYTVEIHRATSRSTLASTAKGSNGEPSTLPTECPLCYAETTPEEFRDLAACGHRACVTCFRLYLRVEITESRVCIACPECHEPMHPNEIRSILDNPNLFEKYEDFMVRRVLAVDPDTRWCPAPDCGFAVIASECASCPKLRCERPGCDSFFCYHCKAEWHPNQTCDAARAQRSPHRHAGAAGAAAAAGGLRSSSLAFSQDSHRGGLAGDDMKPCPRCQVLIAKMDDGSCNHMMCAVCGAEFCWLCMKEINDLHFLSPSGCTFWGKKPWSRKKKILWQLGTLVGAPVGIALVAGITVPAMLIGIPVWVGKKLRARYKSANKHKRHAAMAGGVMASVLIAPILAGLAVGIGVPILLFYVYGVVPVSLCRSGGCGGGGTGASDDDDGSMGGVGTRAPSAYDASSAKATDPSIGEASLSMASGSQVLRDADRDSASTVALAGSLSQATQRLEVQADVVSAQRFSMSSLTESMNNSIAPDDGGASVRALAGSMLSYKPPDSDCCSCITTEDCTSERVHFDDNVSFIASQEEKTSIGSGCSSFRPKCSAIYIDIEEKPRKYSLQASILRSQFFHSISDGKPATKSLDDKTIIEVSNETLDKQSVPLIGENPTSVVICQLKSASTLNLESSKL